MLNFSLEKNNQDHILANYQREKRLFLILDACFFESSGFFSLHGGELKVK